MVSTNDLLYFSYNINRLSHKLGKIQLNMGGKSEPAFTCIKTKSVVNVLKRVNKGSDMPVLVKFLKHRYFLKVLHFTVILLNIRAQFVFYCFVSAYTIKDLLLL